MSSPSFMEAQIAVLDRHGVVAEDRYVDVPVIGGQAHVLVAGEGPPVVVINGIGTPAAMFAALLAELDGHTQYAVDLPGYGLTDTTPTLTNQYRTTAVLFLEQVLDALELDRAAFVTNSIGSLWAIWFAIDRPDRVTAMVHVGWPALVLDTSAPLPMRLLSVRGLGRVMTRIQPPSPRQVRQLSKMVREYPLPPEVARLLLATQRLPGFEPTFLATLNRLVRLRGARPEFASTADHLAQIRQPTRIILGADDPFGTASDGERLASALPDADLHIVDGGHAPWLHHADQIAPLVTDFLDRQAPTTQQPSRESA